MTKNHDFSTPQDLGFSIQEFCKEYQKVLLLLGWFFVCLILSTLMEKWLGFVYAIFSGVCIAIGKCIQAPSKFSKRVKNIEANGDVSTVKEISTITKLLVHTQHIRVASFKALSGPEYYKSSFRKKNRSHLDPSSGIKPPVTLRQGKRQVDKPPTRTGRASTSNFNCISKQMKETALALEYEPTAPSGTSSKKKRCPKENNIHISEA